MTFHGKRKLHVEMLIKFLPVIFDINDHISKNGVYEDSSPVAGRAWSGPCEKVLVQILERVL